MTREMAELTEVELEALVRRARAGDHGALGELYDRVARFAAGRLGDAERAEDVTSETFEGVLRGLPAYRPGTDFDSRRGCSPSPTAASPTTSGGGPGVARSSWRRPGDDERRLRGLVGLPDRGPHAIRLLVEAHGLTLETLRSAVRGELDRPA
jgi:sigma-70-like protein